MIYIIYSLYIYEQIVHIVILKLLYVIIVPKCLSYKRLKIVCIYIYIPSMNSHAAQRFASLEDLLPSTCQPLAVSQKVPALPQRLDTNCWIYETAESKGFQSHPKVKKMEISQY